jgi:hypothetical protein
MVWHADHLLLVPPSPGASRDNRETTPEQY